MKKILKTAAILLILAGSFSCENEEIWENVPVEYVKCPCDQEKIDGASLNWRAGGTENVLMIDISKTTDDKILELLESEKIRQYLRYDSTDGSAAFLFNPHQLWQTSGRICNFPSQYDWEIPINGIHVSFACDIFDLCEPILTIPEHSYFNIVLTSLKIQQK
jgi:hypothetical protein